MALPKALYRGESGHFEMSFPLYGTLVQLSGNPCRRSHSIGVNRLKAKLPFFKATP